ncbi:MAG: TonB-dependent receptor [Halieaceae bacterium]|nr:TonB-dependent receptor [Halieaceae bacterium]
MQPAIGAENRQLEEIIVLAQKVKENILEVPVSVTVIQGESLQERGATNITGLNGIAPNVILNDVLFVENGGKFSIRGIGFFDIDPLSDQKTQIMVDGIPHARNTGVTYDQVDIQRVEILRGPQGTLFGRGSMAGTVNYVSRTAADEPGVSLRLSASEYGTNRYVLTVETGPIFDGAVRGRLTGSRRTTDGYIRNAFNGNMLGNKESHNTRLRIDHETDFAITSFILYELEDSVAGLGLTNQVQDPYGISDGDVNLVNIDQDGFRNSSEQGFSVLSEIPLDIGYLALLANTHKSEFLTYVDLDGRVGLHPPAPLGFSNAPFHWGFDIEQEQESFELRYHNQESERWNLVAGVFLFRENVERIFHQNIGPPFSETLAFEDSFETALARQNTRSQAVFGQAGFAVSDTVSLIAGARMTSEEKSADLTDYPLPPPSPQAPVSRFTPSHQWDQPTWKLGVEIQPNEATMYYLTASTGYKPGGFNGRATLPENVGPYAAEHSISLEAGVKGTLLDKRMRFAFAGFTTEYTDIVGLIRRPTATGRGTESVSDNIGGSSIKGLEFESTWLATADLEFDFALGYLNAEWDSYNADLNGDGMATDNTHLAILMAPEFSTYGAITYSQEFSAGTMQYRVDVRYQSSYNVYGRSNEDLYFRPATAKVNASATWIWGDAGNSISVYGRNLTDRQVVSQALVGIFPVMKFDPPRMLGVELKLNF